MQTRRHDGSYGDVMPFTDDNLKNELAKKDTKHVEVFDGTPHEIAFRKMLAVKPKFKKAKK